MVTMILTKLKVIDRPIWAAVAWVGFLLLVVVVLECLR